MKADPLPTAPIEQIRQHLVALRMPRALEMLDHLVHRIERGQLGTIEAIEALLAKATAQRSRCLTYEDLEAALPARDVSAEDLEAIFWILAEHGIEVEDGEG